MPQPSVTLNLPKAWPFEEAARLAERMARSGKAEALFETGYGPSGLPHIGTFGEVARTGWVRHAYTVLTGAPSRLLAFSDDMDGLRKVPDNVPDRDKLTPFLGQPLTRVPDPFGTHESFGAHNNARLRAFLDRFGFGYEFASASDYYRSGRFDAALIRVLETHDEILSVVLPTLGPERRATYSPVLPIHPRTGVVMQVPIEHVDAHAGTVAWRDPEEWRGVRDERARWRGQAAVEGRLGDALARARRRLRNVGQGPDRQHEAVVEDRAHPRVRAAGQPDLRAVSRRARPEDQQVPRQRHFGR